MSAQPSASVPITLFLCGDVMTGRGVDQLLPHPSEPRIFEPYMSSAADYITLAEDVVGKIERPVSFDYVWGDALAVLAAVRPDVRIVNLETAVTTNDEPWPAKGIQYRMHPANVPCLSAARLDCCVLANNHVLDWGHRGLDETLKYLHAAGLRTAGAGRNAAEAAAPAVIGVPEKGRVLVFACALGDSGVPRQWRATAQRPGVTLLENLSTASVEEIAQYVRREKTTGDVVVLSIHWGGNWGFEITPEERSFAHRLIDMAGVDVVHGHSSHHVKGIEVYRDRPIIYGCGDFLNDYEGISGHEAYRGDLSLMYFPTLNASTGGLVDLALIPTQVRRFRVNRASTDGAAWLYTILNREGERLGSRVERLRDYGFHLRWRPSPAG